MKTDSYVCPMTLPCCGCAQLAESCTSVCSLCGHCSECSQCSECNKYNLAQKNNQKYIKSKKIQFHEEEKRGVSQNSINNYKIQLFNKDKTIMNYTKQIEEQNKKLEALDNSLKLKDKQISQLENIIKELNLNIENQKKEIYNNNELIDKYKFEIESQMHASEQNQTIYDNNFNNMTSKLEENQLKINELEKINNKLNTDINQLQKEIYSKNEIIENNNLINTKLTNENKNLPLLNKKLIEYQNNIKLLKDENANMKKYNLDLSNENQKLNQKLNQLLKEINQKENKFNVETYNINSKLNKISEECQSTSDNLEKCKLEKDALIQEQEKYYNFVNNKLNEINEFIIHAFNTMDINKLSEELNINKYISENKYNAGGDDIKYELVENAISEMKKNILKFILNVKEKNNKYLNDFNNITRDKDILESHNSEMENELNIYRQNQNEIENKNKEIAFNYEKLRDSYTKLYNDYNIFTNSNEKYVKDTQNFFLELIEKIKYTLGDKNIFNKEKALNEILKDCIDKLVAEYKLMIKKIEENEKKDEITYKKVIELGNLLEESQRIGKDFEAENRRLKQEIERLKYRYNLLKASIDTVEYKIKTES